MAEVGDQDVDALLAQARPLRPAVDPLKVDVATLLPPEAIALADQIDNDPSAPAAPAEGEDEVATLDFVGDTLPVVEVTLKFPFRWEGVRHDTITVRQLTTAEIGRVSGEWGRSGKAPMLMDIYAVMTGLPARVLRALPHQDGDRVISAAYDFLPPSYRGEDD